MTLEDLRTLEIGLELYKREKPLDGHCEELIAFLLRVLRHDIVRKGEQASSRSGRGKSREKSSDSLPPNR
jgi:hypothetical protein